MENIFDFGNIYLKIIYLSKVITHYFSNKIIMFPLDPLLFQKFHYYSMSWFYSSSFSLFRFKN